MPTNASILRWIPGALLLCNLAAGCDDAAPITQTDAGATEDADLSPFACPIPLPTSCSNPTRRYADLVPIFVARCGSCHAGETNGPWPLNSYQSVSDWADAIRDDLANCTMPPADGGLTMLADERAAILDWIRCGYPP